MAMFLEQQTAAEATSQQPHVVAAAPTSTAAITARKVDITPSVDRPQGQQPTDPQQQPNGMSPLEHETALAMLGILTKYKEADPFRNPVDVEELHIPDYFDIITQPMDFKTVRQKVRQTSKSCRSAASSASASMTCKLGLVGSAHGCTSIGTDSMWYVNAFEDASCCFIPCIITSPWQPHVSCWTCFCCPAACWAVL